MNGDLTLFIILVNILLYLKGYALCRRPLVFRDLSTGRSRKSLIVVMSDRVLCLQDFMKMVPTGRGECWSFFIRFFVVSLQFRDAKSMFLMGN